MCRLAAYLGQEIKLENFLIHHEHSLVKQSWAPNEMLDGTINADGYGLAWLSDLNNLCQYRNLLPIWSDSNLKGLSQSISSPLWLANVRSATPGQAINEANTQPFIHENLVFTHNGFIKPFNNEIKANLLSELRNETQTMINGDSDSLYLFALLYEHYDSGKSLKESILNWLEAIKSILGKNSAMLNFIISDIESLYAIRYAINQPCPSLYYVCSKSNIWLASEPLSNDLEWVEFPENSLMQFDKTGHLFSTDI